MGHHHHNTTNLKAIKIAFWLNFISAFAEFIIGNLIGSKAITADALHDFGDSIIIAGSLILTFLAHKKPSEKYTFGYKKLLLLNVVLNTGILLAGSFWIIYSAWKSLGTTHQVLELPMIITAVFGILVNAIGFKVLHSESSMNSKAVSFHLLEDILGWIAVLIGGIVIYFTGWNQVDTYLSLAISLLIIRNAGKMLYQALQLILLKVPKEINIKELCRKISLETQCDVKDFHLWTPDGEEIIASLHIQIPVSYSERELIQLKQQIRNLFSRELRQDVHLTIEIDFPAEQEHPHCELQL